MAVIYVRSTDGSDADNGSTWALAKATLVGALVIAGAGDTIWISDNHAETQASAMTITSPGTVSNPVKILCGDDAAEPPTALATTATITTTGNSKISGFGGFAYVYGVAISATTGVSTAIAIDFNATTPYGWTFDACKLIVAGTASASTMQFGTQSASIDDQYVELINTTFKFAAVGQQIGAGSAILFWKNTLSAIDTGGSIPTSLFKGLSSLHSDVRISNVDLSGLGSGKNLIVASSASAIGRFMLRNCKLGSSVAIITGTIAGPGGIEVYLDNCDSADTITRMEYYKYQGSIVSDVTVYCTDPQAYDGATRLSWKMVTLTAGPSFNFPLESPPIFQWNESTSSLTATIEIYHDSVTALKDNEIWMELEYLGTSANPIGTMISDRASNILTASAADQAASINSNWTGSIGSNPNTQKLNVTFTPNKRGLFRAVVKIAKTNYTVYVNPKLTIT